MYPRLFELFGEPVPAYFTMLVVGFALATWLGARWAERSGLDREVIIDLGLFSLIAGVIGGRLLHVLADGYFWDYVHLCTDPSQVFWQIPEGQCVQVEGVWDSARQLCQPKPPEGFWDKLDYCFAWAAFWRGGLAYYGGLLSGAVFGVWFLRRERFPVLKAVDMAGMVIPIGLFFGRMGCFLGGCCFGLHTDHAFGISFPSWSPASEAQYRAGELAGAHLPSLPVHPTQLYEAAGSLAIAGLMMFVLHPRKRFDGQVGLAFLALYSVLRFVIEYLRADDRGALWGLSTSQLIGVAILAFVAVAWRRLARRVA